MKMLFILAMFLYSVVSASAADSANLDVLAINQNPTVPVKGADPSGSALGERSRSGEYFNDVMPYSTAAALMAYGREALHPIVYREISGDFGVYCFHDRVSPAALFELRQVLIAWDPHQFFDDVDRAILSVKTLVQQRPGSVPDCAWARGWDWRSEDI